ncbi:MAG: GntR family transcriptional regulator [Sphaerisporangium sp.]|nr:GntR family transcriptional regulator [Sphaerisporangium sp.]
MPGQTRSRPLAPPTPNTTGSPVALSVSPPSRPEAPAKVSDAAYHELRARIVDLTYSPGEMLNELQLSKRMGIGRMPLREAVARLAQERFISVIPRRGMVIANLSFTEVLNLMEARLIVETGLVRELCGKISDAELAELTTLFEAVNEAGATGDYLRFLEQDHVAHVRLAQMVRNDFLGPLAESLHLHNLRFWRYCHRNRMVTDGHIQPHGTLLQALRHRDPDAAEQAIRQLVHTSRASIQGLF